MEGLHKIADGIFWDEETDILYVEDEEGNLV